MGSGNSRNYSGQGYTCQCVYIHRNNYHGRESCVARRHKCICEMKRTVRGQSGSYSLCEGPQYCKADFHKGLVQVY